jgi:hypothetical protein
MRNQWPAACRIAWDLHNVNSDRSISLVDGSLHHSIVRHKRFSKSPLGRNAVYGNSHSFNAYLPRGFYREKIKYIVLTALSCTQHLRSTRREQRERGIELNTSWDLSLASTWRGRTSASAALMSQHQIHRR